MRRNLSPILRGLPAGRRFSATIGTRGTGAGETLANNRLRAPIRDRDRAAVRFRVNLAAALVDLHDRGTGGHRGLRQVERDFVAGGAVKVEMMRICARGGQCDFPFARIERGRRADPASETAGVGADRQNFLAAESIAADERIG